MVSTAQVSILATADQVYSVTGMTNFSITAPGNIHNICQALNELACNLLGPHPVSSASRCEQRDQCICPLKVAPSKVGFGLGIWLLILIKQWCRLPVAWQICCLTRHCFSVADKLQAQHRIIIADDHQGWRPDFVKGLAASFKPPMLMWEGQVLRQNSPMSSSGSDYLPAGRCLCLHEK